MDINYLFWNTYRKGLFSEIGEIVKQNSVNVVILCEHDDPNCILLNSLNQIKPFNEIIEVIPVGKKIRIFSDLSFLSVIDIQDGWNFRIIKMELNDHNILLLGLVYIQSKREGDEDTQFIDSTEISDEMSRTQDNLACQKMVICGDFNMNPFEKGMMIKNGFNVSAQYSAV
jgi:exonuclease III